MRDDEHREAGELVQRAHDGSDRTSSWSPVDIRCALEDPSETAPTLMHRVDGVALVYPGKTHWFQGEPESLKSWAAQAVAAEAMRARGRVLYVDFEDDVRAVIERFRAMGLTDEVLVEHLHYVRPDEPLLDRGGRATKGNAELGRLLSEHCYEVCVVDGVTESMSIESLDLNSNGDVAAWLTRLPKRLAASGAAVICIDHVVKSKDGRGRFALGGQQKLAGVTGAVYGFELQNPVGRARERTVEGRVVIRVHKDRPGHVRSMALEGAVAVMVLSSATSGEVVIRFDCPSPREPVSGGERDRVVELLRFIDAHPGCTGSAIEAARMGKAELVRERVAQCAAPPRGWIDVQVEGRARRHFLTEAGRAEIGHPSLVPTRPDEEGRDE